jgi:hypothetical protein
LTDDVCCAGEGETSAPIDLDAIQVDPSYAGPKLRDDRVGNIDLPFITGTSLHSPRRRV